MNDPDDSRLRSAGAVRARRRRVSRARAGRAQLRARGYDTELVSVPFKWYPKQEILAHAAAWRLLDLSESNGRPIDLVIATKFPTYFVRHPNKVAWLIHQYRAAYELCGTPYSDFAHTEDDVGLRDAADRARHRDARRVPAALRQLAQHRRARWRSYNGLTPTPLYHPPRLAPTAARRARHGDYVLSVGRLESVKRVDLAIRAMAHAPADAVARHRRRRARSAPTLEALRRVARRRRPRAFPRRGRRRRSDRALRRRARR